MATGSNNKRMVYVGNHGVLSVIVVYNSPLLLLYSWDSPVCGAQACIHTPTALHTHMNHDMIHVILKTKLVKLKLVKVLAQLLHEHHIMFSLYSPFSFIKCPPSTGWWLWHCHLRSVIIPVQFIHFWGLVLGVGLGVRCPNFISPEANSVQTLLSRISTKALQFSERGHQRISYCVHLKSAISPLNWPIIKLMTSWIVSRSPTSTHSTVHTYIYKRESW